MKRCIVTGGLAFAAESPVTTGLQDFLLPFVPYFDPLSVSHTMNVLVHSGRTVTTHLVRHKGGASKALSAHHERTKGTYSSNPDIDLSRTARNFHLVTPRWSYEQEIKHRISMAGCRVRRGSVKFVDTLVTVSPEFVQEHDAEMPEYFAAGV